MTIKLSHAEGGEADFQRTRRATSRTLCTRSRSLYNSRFKHVGVKPPKAKLFRAVQCHFSVTSIGKVPVATGTDWGGAVNHSSIKTYIKTLTRLYSVDSKCKSEKWSSQVELTVNTRPPNRSLWLGTQD